MTEADHLKEFINWAEANGKLTEKDFAQFVRWRKARKKAENFVNENFKGMF